MREKVERDVVLRSTSSLPEAAETEEPSLETRTSRVVGSEKATPEEIEQNPRAASVRLRAVELVRATGPAAVTATSRDRGAAS